MDPSRLSASLGDGADAVDAVDAVDASRPGAVMTDPPRASGEAPVGREESISGSPIEFETTVTTFDSYRMTTLIGDGREWVIKGERATRSLVVSEEKVT